MIIDWSGTYIARQEMYVGAGSEKSLNWIITFITSAFPFTYYSSRSSKWRRSSVNV